MCYCIWLINTLLGKFSSMFFREISLSLSFSLLLISLCLPSLYLSVFGINFIKIEYDLKLLLHYQCLLSNCLTCLSLLELILVGHMHLEICMFRLSNLVEVRHNNFQNIIGLCCEGYFFISSFIKLNVYSLSFGCFDYSFVNLFIFKESALCFIDSFFPPILLISVLSY